MRESSWIGGWTGLDTQPGIMEARPPAIPRRLCIPAYRWRFAGAPRPPAKGRPVGFGPAVAALGAGLGELVGDEARPALADETTY